jgi:hypothetical protein
MVLRLIGCTALACFLSGCTGSATDADYGSLGLVSVSGTVTLDGAPLAGALVQFETPEDRTYSSGTTDSSGSYTLEFNSERSGVLPGKKIVRIRGGGGDSDDSSAGTDEEDSDAPAAESTSAATAVPACYNTDSKLAAEVTSSTTRFDFDLKSDCSTTGPK